MYVNAVLCFTSSGIDIYTFIYDKSPLVLIDSDNKLILNFFVRNCSASTYI